MWGFINQLWRDLASGAVQYVGWEIAAALGLGGLVIAVLGWLRESPVAIAVGISFPMSVIFIIALAWWLEIGLSEGISESGNFPVEKVDSAERVERLHQLFNANVSFVAQCRPGEIAVSGSCFWAVSNGARAVMLVNSAALSANPCLEPNVFRCTANPAFVSASATLPDRRYYACTWAVMVDAGTLVQAEARVLCASRRSFYWPASQH
jgi:hypothetical protein